MSTQFLNLIFIFNGQRIMIQATSKELFAEVALRYMNKRGLTQDQAPKFFYNSQELKLEAAKTLAELNVTNQANIDVVLSSLVIGAFLNK